MADDNVRDHVRPVPFQWTGVVTCDGCPIRVISEGPEKTLAVCNLTKEVLYVLGEDLMLGVGEKCPLRESSLLLSIENDPYGLGKRWVLLEIDSVEDEQ